MSYHSLIPYDIYIIHRRIIRPVISQNSRHYFLSCHLFHYCTPTRLRHLHYIKNSSIYKQISIPTFLVPRRRRRRANHDSLSFFPLVNSRHIHTLIQFPFVKSTLSFTTKTRHRLSNNPFLTFSHYHSNE